MMGEVSWFQGGSGVAGLYLAHIWSCALSKCWVMEVSNRRKW